VLTFLTYDKPLWFIFIAMFLIGLGLGQMMQTLTMASQNAVKAHQMGVATGASTFFRQIGGTLGVAVLLSVLFAALPSNILTATADKPTLTSALTAALTPSVADDSNNKAIMKQLWNPIVDPIKANVQKQLTAGVAKGNAAAIAAVTTQVTAGVGKEVAAGVIPAAEAPTIIAQQVAAATPRAEAAVLTAVAKGAHATVVGDTVSVDWANASQRSFYVDKLVPTISKEITKSNSKASSSSSNSISDTSFLNGADPRLTKPFKVGFNTSVVQIYWVGLGVILAAFILSLFFRVPPMRKTSALQERADAAGVTETGRIKVQA
jgi:hypothetical protein